MKQPASYYDRDYFEGNPTVHKSNYTRFGGYQANLKPRNLVPYALAFVDPFRTPTGSTVLELGCAYGYLVDTLRRMGYDAWGMDISEFALSMAEPNVKPYLLHGDIAQTIPSYPPDPNRKWDLVISMDVLEHAESVEEVQAILQRIAVACHHQVHIVTTIRSPHFHTDPSHGVGLTLDEWNTLKPNESCYFYESPW